MANAYVVRSGGRTDEMQRVRCTDEDKELQLILEKNPNLLPGEQIDPDNPRRWLLIKREMPVPDPNTGSDRWNIDLLFADQDATPTFVECKRYADTRSRREVIGQVCEYAANGHYYWTADTLSQFAREACVGLTPSLDDAIRDLQPTDDLTTEAFFARLHDKLREGQVRIILFMEESPTELRSIVDFLNKQMERSELLIVEARQYEREGLRVVIPVLFGYTEEARKVKRSVTVSSASARKQWNLDSFFADAGMRLEERTVQALKKVQDQFLALGYEITWGSGSSVGSFNVKAPLICPRSLMTIRSDGVLVINFGQINGTENAEQTRDRLKELLVTKIGLTVPHDYAGRYPSYPVAQWADKSEVLVAIMSQLKS